jgi:hypothetical protein
VHILIQLFRCGKVQFIAVITAMEITAMVLITPAYTGPMVINIAAVILCQIPAAIGDVYIPVAVFHKNAYPLVCQIPAYIVKIRLCLRFFYRQRYIPTTQTGTFLA